ncbi:MAG: winged helix-turn-helix domain-containing protein [Candidatus Nitrosocosmicus sp.]
MLDITLNKLNKEEEEEEEGISILKELLDKHSYKILLSIVDESKTVFQICTEISVPTSSTYKKIKKLKDVGLLIVDKIEINDNGKKVFFYKSKIRSIELTLNRKQFILQFKRNENTFSKKPIDTASENKVICITEQKQK